ncbi:MAG: DUF4126 family protein [Cytophagales bacterium]|nr:DUF4126 family protein [Armatimonadota bacterium]
MSRLPLRAFGLGFICGMRALLGPALLRHSIAARKTPDREGESPLRNAAKSPPAAFLLPLLATGELIGDKLPAAPNRTDPPSVIFRTLSGASVGAALCDQESGKGARVVGALLGAAGAIAGTYAMFYLRRTASRRTPLPDWVLGIAEDAAAFGIGLTLLREKESRTPGANGPV